MFETSCYLGSVCEKILLSFPNFDQKKKEDKQGEENNSSKGDNIPNNHD